MKLVFLAFAFLCWFGSCVSSSDEIMHGDSNNILAAGLPLKDTVQQKASSLNGRWNLIPALPSDTATGKLPYLNFDLSAGRINGNTGCNSFGGAFIVKQDSIAFSKNMMSTKMACPGYDETAFMNNLFRVNRYEIKGDTLALETDATPVSYWLRK